MQRSDSVSPLALWFAELRLGPLVRLDDEYFDRLDRSISASAPDRATHAC